MQSTVLLYFKEQLASSVTSQHLNVSVIVAHRMSKRHSVSLMCSPAYGVSEATALLILAWNQPYYQVLERRADLFT
jgi:hypothetical protein